jgi:non-specific serine/threonine protein kinase/serine/threonine-protein kinase
MNRNSLTQDIMKIHSRPRFCMTPQRFQEVRAIFEAVISRSEAERLTTLQLLRDRDPELNSEVEGLISVDDRRAEFIEKPAALLDRNPTLEIPAELEGCSIGPYRLLQIVGEGGMGQVWRAEQTRPVRRIVALKLIKAGMDTREVVRRFESERQAVAVMDHPAIAKVFDAGSTPSGRPYFAMEYVDGLTITKYCDEHRLAIRDRLKLFVRVCEGIQHAHQKAIIHRDIKPSNVLVAEVDGKPLPKIIDFGVARAISPDSADETAFTREGAILGTPEYMSPEQASTLAGTLDTRTDVYSLGVLLYELLVGAAPHEFSGLPLFEVLRTIREEPAQRPSVRYRALGMDSGTAHNRRLTASALYDELHSDLDIIVLKALKRNPENRYGSPQELAADLTRYLRHDPVLARPASAFYVARKYVSRHWVLVAGAAAVFLMLVSFGIWQSVELHRIRRERDRADRIAQFMTEIFQVSDPSESRGNQITAREVLDRASAGIETGLRNDPELQAKLMGLMGGVYFRLGLYGRAESLLRYSFNSRRRMFRGDTLETAQSMHDLAIVRRRQGDAAEAKTLDLEVLAVRTRLLGSGNADTLNAMSSLAADFIDEGQYREAERLQQTVYESDRRLLGPEDSNTLMAMENLGDTLGRQGRFREGEDFERRALEIKRRKLGSDHPDTLHAMQHLAEALYDAGNYPEAEKLDRELLSTRTRVLGVDHPDTLESMVALANPLENENRLPEAEQWARRAIAGEERVLGREHPQVLLAMNNLAGILADQGRYREAEQLDRRVVEIRSRVLGPEHPYTLHSSGILAFILMLKGSLVEAEQLAHRTREAQARLVGPNNPETAEITYTLACIAARRGQTKQAIALLRDAVDHGLRPNAAKGIADEPSLKSLRGDPGFQSLVAKVAKGGTKGGTVAHLIR